MVVSGLVLVLLSRLLLVIAAAVRFTSLGSTLFRQSRLGKDGKPFTCYKFRTMYVDAPDIRNPDGSTLNAEDDPWATQICRFLQKSRLDELRLLINVLKRGRERAWAAGRFVRGYSLVSAAKES